MDLGILLKDTTVPFKGESNHLILSSVNQQKISSKIRQTMLKRLIRI